MLRFANYTSVSLIGAAVLGLLLLTIPVTLSLGEIASLLIAGVVVSSIFASFYAGWFSTKRRARIDRAVKESERREP